MQCFNFITNKTTWKSRQFLHLKQPKLKETSCHPCFCEWIQPIKHTSMVWKYLIPKRDMPLVLAIITYLIVWWSVKSSCERDAHWYHWMMSAEILHVRKPFIMQAVFFTTAVLGRVEQTEILNFSLKLQWTLQIDLPFIRVIRLQF